MSRHVAAIFGIGRIGQVHLRHMVQSIRLTIKWIVDVEAMKDQATTLIDQMRLTGETSFVDIQGAYKVFEDKEVGLVIVCVPTKFHAEITIRALNAGKHVFCEKPLATTLDDVRQCYDAAKNNGKILMCAVNRRFDKQFRSMFDMKQRGDLGEIRVIKMVGRDMGNTEEYYRLNTGGIFVDMGIHDVDYICWVAGERPSSVYATGSRNGPNAEMYKRVGEYDCASALLTFPSGSVAHLELSRESSYGYVQNVEILGTKKFAKSNIVKESELETLTKDGVHSQPVVESFITRFEQSFYDELLHFINSVEGKEECLVTPQSYIISTEVIMALNKSLETGEIVKLSE